MNFFFWLMMFVGLLMFVGFLIFVFFYSGNKVISWYIMFMCVLEFFLMIYVFFYYF